MARLFDDGSNEYVKNGGAVLTAVPLAMVCWFNSNDDTISNQLICITDLSSTDDGFRLNADGITDGDPVYAAVRQAGSQKTASTSAGWTSGQWHHAGGIFASATDRRAFLDGGNKGTEVTAHTPVGGNLDTTAIGAYVSSPTVNPTSGSIAEAAIWDLSDWPGATASDKADEFERQAMSSLASGYSPLFFPLGLTAYWPLGGLRSDDNAGNAANSDWDVVGSYHMDPINTPSVADHPGGLIYPSGPQLVIPAAAAPAGVAPTSHLYGSLVGPLGGAV